MQSDFQTGFGSENQFQDPYSVSVGMDNNFSLPLDQKTTQNQTQNVIDETNFGTKMKHPKLTRKVKLSSDLAIKSYNGIHHNYYLPIIGDYAHGFILNSSYVFKSGNSSTINVNCISNYIDTITLNISNHSSVISRIDNFDKIESLTPQQLCSNPCHSIKLDFLNLPLLIECPQELNYQIAIKFNQPPPVKYEIVYDVMITDDKNYSETLRKETFSVIYQSKNGNNPRKKLELSFKQGKVTALK